MLNLEVCFDYICETDQMLLVVVDTDVKGGLQRVTEVYQTFVITRMRQVSESMQPYPYTDCAKKVVLNMPGILPNTSLSLPSNTKNLHLNKDCICLDDSCALVFLYEARSQRQPSITILPKLIGDMVVFDIPNNSCRRQAILWHFIHNHTSHRGTSQTLQPDCVLTCLVYATFHTGLY